MVYLDYIQEPDKMWPWEPGGQDRKVDWIIGILNIGGTQSEFINESVVILMENSRCGHFCLMLVS